MEYRKVIFSPIVNILFIPAYNSKRHWWTSRDYETFRQCALIHEHSVRIYTLPAVRGILHFQ